MNAPPRSLWALAALASLQVAALISLSTSTPTWPLGAAAWPSILLQASEITEQHHPPVDHWIAIDSRAWLHWLITLAPSLLLLLAHARPHLRASHVFHVSVVAYVGAYALGAIAAALVVTPVIYSVY